MGGGRMLSAAPLISLPVWRQVQRCISFLRALIRWPDWPPALALMGFSQHIVKPDKWPSCDGWAFCLLCELLPRSILSLGALIQEAAARASRSGSVTPFPWRHDANAPALLSERCDLSTFSVPASFSSHHGAIVIVAISGTISLGFFYF